MSVRRWCEAACAYCLISLIDPHCMCAAGCLQGFAFIGARRQRAQSALPGAGQHL